MNDKVNATIFQAVGLINSVPYKDEVLGWAINIQGIRYRLFIPKKLYKGWLKEMAANPKTAFFLRVYPKCFVAPKQPPQIYFHVIAWNKKNENQEHLNLFTLKGFWQFIPQSRLPVLTIYRNKGSVDVTNKFKASHLPVLMRREDVQPYRYNKTDDKPSRYFIQGEFTFIPSKQAFGYRNDIEKPSLEAPKYKKPVKPDTKTEVKKPDPISLPSKSDRSLVKIKPVKIKIANN